MLGASLPSQLGSVRAVSFGTSNTDVHRVALPLQGRVSMSWEMIPAPRHFFLVLCNPFHSVTCYEVSPVALSAPHPAHLLLSLLQHASAWGGHCLALSLPKAAADEPGISRVGCPDQG